MLGRYHMRRSPLCEEAIMADEKKIKGVPGNDKASGKPKTMDELRKPGISNLPSTDDEEFNIASPGPHVPEGQDTHE
jgi:hypothetical protein